MLGQRDTRRTRDVKSVSHDDTINTPTINTIISRGGASTMTPLQELILLNEKAKREMIHFNPNSKFAVNLYSLKKPQMQFQRITEKVNEHMVEVSEDEEFKVQYRRCQQVPREKYKYPKTTSQEIGWDYKPLVSYRTQFGPIQYHPSKRSDMSKFIDMMNVSKKNDKIL